VHAIDADPQNLGVHPSKPVEAGLVGWNLACSYRGEGQGEEDQDDILSAKKITQADFLSLVTFQAEIWSNLTDVERHDDSLQNPIFYLLYPETWRIVRID